jgi:hypothetical protein
MKIYVDIDCTICETKDSNYQDAIPIWENINKINGLYDEGHVITYWTARGGTSGKDWTDLTLSQLYEWGCSFDVLLLDKPSFDLLIDDRTKRIEEISRWD